MELLVPHRIMTKATLIGSIFAKAPNLSFCKQLKAAVNFISLHYVTLNNITLLYVTPVKAAKLVEL